MPAPRGALTWCSACPGEFCTGPEAPQDAASLRQEHGLVHTIESDQKGDVAVPSPGLKGEFQTLPAHRGHRRAVSETLWDSKCNVQK